MKKLIISIAAIAAFVAGPVLAADLPPRQPPPPPYKAPPPVVHSYSWTGCYLGVHGGYGWGKKRWNDPNLGEIAFSRHDVSGGVAGGQIGCDYQVNYLVVGVEGSGSWANLKGNSVDALSGGTLRDSTTVDAIGTITGRIGLAADRALFYVKGGAAIAHDKYRVDCLVIVGVCAAVGQSFQTASNSPWGWVVGAGIEYAFWNNWSVKAEYNYMDFGFKRATFNGPVGPVGTPFDIRQTLHVAKIGLNWRFGNNVSANY